MNMGDISADMDIFKNACAMESVVDELLLEAGDAFELYKQEQEVPTTTSTLVYGRTWFALVEARKPVCPRRPKQILSTVCTYGTNGRGTETWQHQQKVSQMTSLK